MANNAIDDLFYELNGGYLSSVNPDGEKALDNAHKKLAAEIINIIGQESFIKIEDLIFNKTYESEHYGFVTGFKHAMRLMLASGN